MTDSDGDPVFADDDLRAEFAALFPHGWAGPDVLAELAPDGWAASPLAAISHPSAAQVYEETARVHRNLARLGRRPDAPPPPPEPTLAEVTADYQDGPVEAERECQELVGLCLWDIFSDSHEVFAADGRRLDLGSSRGSGGFLAEVLNGQGGPPPRPRPELPDDLLSGLTTPADASPEVAAFMAQMRQEMLGDGGYTYLDFYMGTGMVSGRADLVPVYAMVFRRLRNRGLDWTYHFPRLYAVDFRPLKKQLDEQQRGDEPEWAGYDPSAAFAAEAADREHDDKLADLRASLDDGHREAVEASRGAGLPGGVRTVPGRLAAGGVTAGSESLRPANASSA